MHQYIEAPQAAWIKNKYSIFLAGGISNCSDWQSEVAAKLAVFEHLTVVNPRRKDYNCDDPAQEKIQITWEHLKLREVNQTLFYFAPETLCPITLFEYGSALERLIQLRSELDIMFVACHPDYKRKNDVLIQTELMTNRVKVRDSLDAAMEDVVKFNEYIELKLKTKQCPACQNLVSDVKIH
jgi:hypothetical protein